jgi:pimeloyl-ACP methyl ester carboxylesterase
VTRARSALLLAAVGCAPARLQPPPAPPTAAPPAEIPIEPGRPWTFPTPIVSARPCLRPDEHSWRAAEHERVVDELTKSGLGEMAARLSPEVAEVYPDAQVAALARASAEGRCRRVIYSVDGLRVVGFLLEPAGARPRSLPGVVYARGGNREFGLIDPALLSHLQALADRGFVVAATQYRGVDGGDGREHYGGDDVHDLEALLPLLVNVPAYDGRVYLYGHSRGGMEAYEALRDGLPVRAAAITGGVVDLAKLLRARPEMEQVARDLVPEWTTRQGAELARRSSLRWAAELRVPLLIMHARQDWRVPFGQAEAMAATLARLGREHRLVAFDGDAHQLFLHRAQLVDELVRWFRAH